MLGLLLTQRTAAAASARRPKSDTGSGYHAPAADFLLDFLKERSHWHDLLLLPRPTHPESQAVRFHFTLPQDRHVRHLLHFALTNPVVEGLASRIHLHSESGRFEAASQSVCSFRLCIRDRDHPNLLGSQPDREGAGKVL